MCKTTDHGLSVLSPLQTELIQMKRTKSPEGEIGEFKAYIERVSVYVSLLL